MAFKVSNRSLLVCDCEQTMDIDSATLKDCLKSKGELTVFSHLCRTQIEAYDRAVDADEPLLVACTQEAPLFGEIADEKGGRDIVFTNIRELAGWSDAKKKALPKMAALLAAATHDQTPAGTTPAASQGICLVYGAGQQTLEVAEQLAGRLSVSLLLSDVADVAPPNVVNVPIYTGTIASASGSLGQFEITVDGYAPAMASSRSELAFIMARDGAQSSCDLILDMSGGTPLFPAAGRRDGYFHVDPKHPAAVAKAMFEITDLVGEFEKPIYVTYDEAICAHGRNGKVGCSNCLDNCPLSAIVPDGDNVKIDALVCGGCGNCSASCPTGAVSYAYPQRSDMIGQTQTLLNAYAEAGGKNPVLLLHDIAHGGGLIGAMARYGRGLPANVLPLSVFSATQAGHDYLLAAIAAGAQQIVILAAPDRADELAATEQQIALANAFLAGLDFGESERIRLICEQDPDVVEGLLHDLPKAKAKKPLAFSAIGGKRDIARTVIARLNETRKKPLEMLALPERAPYGRIEIDTKGCTMCLACVSACPVDALADNPERPQVRFTEAACVQCGLCRVTCPESVISLEPRYNFSSGAMTPEVLNEEEPFECIRCGKPFGAKSTVERVIGELQGKHWMFQ
ncbi:MAG: 4Fe-4S binding protein, partial [Hyphomicrobiales bacterium]|nr:4Fe-4S binding protein [Hyphomicrobiales bacterium]